MEEPLMPKLMEALKDRSTPSLGMMLLLPARGTSTNMLQTCRGGREHDRCCHVRVGGDTHSQSGGR
jgi:hypothetical protein